MFAVDRVKIRVIVLNTKYNNISVILWWSVLLVEETRVPGENHRPVASH
jgi:DNA-binding beta-propeller fold protein YncE